MARSLPAPVGAGPDQGGAGPLSMVSSSLWTRSKPSRLLRVRLGPAPHYEVPGRQNSNIQLPIFEADDHPRANGTPRYLPEIEMRPLGVATTPSPRPFPPTSRSFMICEGSQKHKNVYAVQRFFSHEVFLRLVPCQRSPRQGHLSACDPWRWNPQIFRLRLGPGCSLHACQCAN